MVLSWEFYLSLDECLYDEVKNLDKKYHQTPLEESRYMFDFLDDLDLNRDFLRYCSIPIDQFLFPLDNGLYRNIGLVLQRSFQYPVSRIEVSFRLRIFSFQFKGVKWINYIDYPFLCDIGNHGAVMSRYTVHHIDDRSS